MALCDRVAERVHGGCRDPVGRGSPQQAAELRHVQTSLLM